MRHNRYIGPLTHQARQLHSLLDDPEVSIDRVAAAIAVAIDRTAPPVAEQLEAIDALVADDPGRIDGPTAVMEHVFGKLRFAPNATNYYALSNSLLHEVLESRRGNPISLAIVAIEVGRRFGVDLMPIGMPAHFLIGYSTSGGLQPDRWFDPFAAGRELNEVSARELFGSLTPDGTEFHPKMLAETPLRFVASRIVANIKNAAIRAGDISIFVAACELAVGVPGAGLGDYKALVRALSSSGRHDRAAELFQWLAANDAPHAGEHRANYQRQVAHRN